MSKTSGTDEQVLSLPKGGGDVRGLGGTFETDLNTGTGSYGIPIETPAGPNGIKPQIGLRYHSAAGNGPFGIGWTLGSMTIARKTDGRLPDYGPDDDAFVLVGVEDLVAMGGGEYRLRVDTMHARIRRQGDGWELTDVNGIRHVLGASAQARVEVVEGGRRKTAAWLLDEMRDLNGNAVRYRYRADGSQRYLERIEWGTYALAFDYEARPDPLTSGRFGFLLPTALRCRRIELHVTNLAPTLARSWTLEYVQAEGSALSLLRRVTLRGHAADGSTLAAPAVTLDYTRMGRRTLERVETAPGSQPDAFAFGTLELIDWDGDGLPDLIEVGRGRARVWPNRGRGRWGYPRSLSALPAPLTLDEPGVAFADMQGNGTADLVLLDRPLSGFYPLRPGGGFEEPVHWRQVPSVPLGSGRARLMDLDGNGVSDLLVTGDSFFSLYLRDGDQGWQERPITLSRGHFPPVSFEDPRVRLADMNGDGLQDLVRVDGGGVVYWPYLGNGRWADPVEMTNRPKLPRDFQPRRLQLVDVDGDGCTDLVYLDHDRVIVWLNQGGVRLGDPQEIPYLPAIDPDQVRVVDFKGGGTLGVLWSNASYGTRSGGYRYLDLAGGVKPYLLTRIENGLGLETLVRYRSSTEFALDDAEAGRAWPTFHPFPLQCVSEVEQHDLVTDQRALTRYHYHDGRYDGEARSFLGFGTVDVDNLGDEAAPTLRTHNVYHLGLDPADPQRHLSDAERLRLGALRRRLLRTESYSPDGSAAAARPFQVVTHAFDVRVDPAADGESVLVPFETRTFEEQYERGTSPFAFREIVYAAPDAHGNIPHQRMRVWQAGQEGTPDQDVTTDVTFAVDEAAHLVGLPARVTQRDPGGAVLAVTVHHYDGPAHQGLPEGQVAKGNLTLQQSLVLTDGLATALYGAAQPDWAALGYQRRAGEGGWWATQCSYDRQDTAAGLVLRVRSARGHDTVLEHDPTRQYPARMTDPRGNVIEGTADERVFQMARLKDANGHETIDRFDALGRVVATVKPGDTDALPSSTFEYRTASLPIRQAAFHRIAHGAAETQADFQIFDGRGELIQQIVPGEGDPGRQFVAQETREYSVRGQVKRRSFPFYTSTSERSAVPAGTPSITLRYDAVGRLLEERKPSGAAVVQAFRPGRVELVDEAGRTLIHRVDGLRRVLEVERTIDGRPVVQRYHYDAQNRLARVEHPGGGETRLTYDLLGRVLVEETPDTGRTLFVVDAAGNQARRTTAGGRTVHMTYDALNRIEETREEGAAAPELRYQYLDGADPAPPDGVRNRRGRPWQIQDAVGTLTCSYDELGRVTENRRTVDALAGHDLTTTVSYDALGRQTRILLPEPTAGAGRRVVDYQYGPRGMPVASPGHVRDAEYDVQGHLVRLVYDNGVENLLDHDLVTGRPQRMQVIAPAGGSLRDQTFTFDPSGNLRRIDSPRPLEAGQFVVDGLDRLTKADYGNGDAFTYAYADNGNVTSVGGVGAFAYGGPAGSGAVTAAGGQAYSYDIDGHLRTAPYGTLHFDALDNLRRVDLADGRTMECVYDYLGQRAIRRLSTGQAAIFADASIEFHDGVAVVWVSFGGRRILALSGTGGVFLHGDLLGTATLFTALDGSEARRLALGPYGTLRFDSGGGVLPEPRRFGGQPLDDATGLYCLGRRYYDPRLGRFISADRAVPGIYRVDSWNRYSYALNNPLRFTDPTGRISGWDVLAIIGIAIVVAALVVAGIFTGGATWAVAGVVINVSAVLFSTAAAMAVGAVLGGIAAAKAGGDIWKGVLFGGLVGGAAGFAGGFLGALAGGLANSLIGSIYVKLIVAGAVQGAIVGAGTGAAVGFAGGKGTADSIWEHIWKGAAIGAVTGALLGFVSAYISQNPYLQLGIPDKLNPQVAAGGSVADKLTYLDTSASLGQGVARGATGTGGIFGLGSFVGFGSTPASLALNLSLKVGIDFVINSGVNYAIIAVASGTFIGLDKYNILEFSDVLVFVLEITPFFVGVVLTFLDDANVGFFEDAKKAVHSGFDLPQGA